MKVFTFNEVTGQYELLEGYEISHETGELVPTGTNEANANATSEESNADDDQQGLRDTDAESDHNADEVNPEE